MPRLTPRADLIDGEIYAHPAQRVVHVRTKIRTVNALARSIRNAGLNRNALCDGVLIRILEKNAFEPDALVYGGDPLPGNAIEVPNPVIVI